MMDVCLRDKDLSERGEIRSCSENMQESGPL